MLSHLKFLLTLFSWLITFTTLYCSHVIILDQSHDNVSVNKHVRYLYLLQSSFKDIHIINITHDIILSLRTHFISFKITRSHLLKQSYYEILFCLIYKMYIFNDIPYNTYSTIVYDECMF